MRILITLPGGGFKPVRWMRQLDWKAYGIAAWRLHVLDHGDQAKKMLAPA
jgi:hypothetical protein